MTMVGNHDSFEVNFQCEFIGYSGSERNSSGETKKNITFPEKVTKCFARFYS